jgi:tetratricopeptide (TPR) repeat protein
VATTDGFAGGIVELLAGDYAAAEEKFRAGYEVLEAAGERAALSTLAAQLAQVVYAQGRYVEAQRIAEASQEMGGAEDLATQMGWRGVMAKVLARQGLADEAERVARDGVDLAERTDFGWRGDQFMDMAEVLRLLNRPAEAIPFLERAIELYEQKGNVPNAERAGALLAELRTNG